MVQRDVHSMLIFSDGLASVPCFVVSSRQQYKRLRTTRSGTWFYDSIVTSLHGI